jgi:hypothetical protein
MEQLGEKYQKRFNATIKQEPLIIFNPQSLPIVVVDGVLENITAGFLESAIMGWQRIKIK